MKVKEKEGGQLLEAGSFRVDCIFHCIFLSTFVKSKYGSVCR